MTTGSESSREKWERRYREGAYAERVHPTPLVVEWLDLAPAGPALDVACGAGRNALHLASLGRTVDGIDISPTALERARRSAAERGLDARFIEADLDEDPEQALPAGPYALIVVVRYVHLGLLPALVRRLAPGGVLIVEQHLDWPEPVIGPSTPAFRMRPNELLRLSLDACGGDGEVRYEVRYYREGLVVDPDGRTAALAQLVLRKSHTSG
ncbi:MAG TPA: class I SAM-dependent methyltransferase [Gammaproteobacteria bacterium]